MALRGPLHNPKMSIIYRVCEQDFISLPNTGYFKTQYLSQSATFVWLEQSWRPFQQLWLLREASCFDTAPEGKCQGCPLSPFPSLLNEALLRNIIASLLTVTVKDLSQCVIDKRSRRMWGMWRQTALSWMCFLIEFPCRSVGRFFPPAVWIKHLIRKDF